MGTKKYYVKHPQDEYDLELIFTNTDPKKTPTIQAVVSCVGVDRLTGVDVSASLFNVNNFSVSENSAFIWVRGGQTDGSVYDVTVVVLTTDGKNITAQFELNIDKYGS